MIGDMWGRILEVVLMYVFLAVPIVTFFVTTRFNIFVRLLLMVLSAVISFFGFGVCIMAIDAICGFRHP